VGTFNCFTLGFTGNPHKLQSDGQYAKLREVAAELGRLDLDVVALQETKVKKDAQIVADGSARGGIRTKD
jgi:hypothetical protein